jgi:hypothetical protein
MRRVAVNDETVRSMIDREVNGVLRRYVLVLAMLGFAGATAGAHAAERDTTQGQTPSPLVVAKSCVSECQAQHDRCRVETKGSRTCDEVRQHCLQICLRKKRK